MAAVSVAFCSAARILSELGVEKEDHNLKLLPMQIGHYLGDGRSGW